MVQFYTSEIYKGMLWIRKLIGPRITDNLRFPDKEEPKKQDSNIEEEKTDTKIVEIK